MSQKPATNGVGARCQEAREMAGLSIEQAAALVDSAASAITEIESDARSAQPNELARLADIYGVALLWLEQGQTSSTPKASFRGSERVSNTDRHRVEELLAALSS
jgi:transcriptional regulator with XRE-family HTH domain